MQVRVSTSPSSMAAVMVTSFNVISGSFSAMSAQDASMAPAMMESSARAALSNVFPVMIQVVSGDGYSADTVAAAATVFVHSKVVTTGKWSE